MPTSIFGLCRGLSSRSISGLKKLRNASRSATGLKNSNIKNRFNYKGAIGTALVTNTSSVTLSQAVENPPAKSRVDARKRLKSATFLLRKPTQKASPANSSIKSSFPAKQATKPLRGCKQNGTTKTALELDHSIMNLNILLSSSQSQLLLATANQRRSLSSQASKSNVLTAASQSSTYLPADP